MDVIRWITWDVAVHGFSIRHIRIMCVFNEGNVLNVPALSQFGERTSIYKAFHLLGGSFCLKIEELLISNWLAWSCRCAKIVFGFALGLLSRVRASSLEAAVVVDSRNFLPVVGHAG